MKTLITLCAALALTGCATDKPVIFTPDPSQQVKLQIDDRLLVDCPAMPEGVSIVSTDDITTAHGADAKLYGDCRRRHNELAAIVRQKLEDQK
jgi:hypothetical protein